MVERRTKVTESCKEIVRARMFAASGGPYETTDVSLVEALPGSEFDGKLDTSIVATGYNFDDGGRQGETGSDLVRYVWTLEYMVLAVSSVWGKNIADTVAAAFDVGDVVSLLDIGGTRSPTGETALVTYSQAQRAVVRDPRPWEEFVWMTRVKLEDYFYASQP